MLEISDIHASYGDVRVLYGVSFTARAGEITCLLGRNGAGKTTALKTIMGLVKADSGSVSLNAQSLSTLPAHQVPSHRVGYVPQGRRLFPDLTVEENLKIGLMTCNEGPQTRSWVLEIFPRLRERLSQHAGTLSGGEQQMLATARAMCLRPKVLLLDEPTEGLQPSMIQAIRDVIVQMKTEGVAVILVEQRVDAIMTLADRAVFIENGRNIETLDREELHANPQTLTRHLGV
jgi:branched-chain amino acid transport system ATP-binding protein